MSTTPNNVSDNQEIDLSQISRKIGQGFQNIGTFIFNCIQFLIRNLIYLIIIAFVGVLIGYFLDKGMKSYKHEIYVNPNFGSTNILYSKIDLLQAKIKEKDTVFFRSIGLRDTKSILSIEIEPIIDVYGLVNDRSNTVSNAHNSQNFELLKLLSESADINKVIKEDLTGRNYSTHLIRIQSNDQIKKENLIDPILNFLNNEEYLNKIQKEYFFNTQNKILKSEEVVKQIDLILEEFNSKEMTSKRNDKLIYYNDNNQLNEILNTKNRMISDIGFYKTELIAQAKIINDKSTVLNVKETKSIFLKMKFILPIVFILVFIIFATIRSFYKRQSIKIKS